MRPKCKLSPSKNLKPNLIPKRILSKTMTRISYKWANKTPKLKIHNSTKTKTTHVSPLKNDNNRSKRNSHQTFPILIDKKWSSRTSSSKPKFMNWPNKWTKSWPGKRNPKSTEFMPINKKMKSSKPKNNN